MVAFLLHITQTIFHVKQDKKGTNIRFYFSITIVHQFFLYFYPMQIGRSHIPKGRIRSYRWGFGGQMKDNEIYGEGNAYTAEFWEYDPRIARRWNVDPVTKPWRSPYDAFDNTPLWKVDPRGDDDFFNKDGTHNKELSTPTGTNIYVQNSEGVYIILTHYQISTVHDALVISNVVNYYAKQVGVTGAVGASWDIKHPQSPAHTTFDTENSEGRVEANVAFKDDINIFNNSNIVMNILFHEKLHQDRGPTTTFLKHAELYLDQILHPSFKAIGNSKEGEDYKVGTISSFTQRVLNEYIVNLDPRVAWGMIDKFNDSNTGYKIIVDWRYGSEDPTATTYTIVNLKTKTTYGGKYKPLSGPGE